MRHCSLVQKTAFYSSVHGSLAITIFLPPTTSSMFSGLDGEVMLQMPHLGLSTSVSSLCFDQFWFSVTASKSFLDKECTCPWV